MDNFEQTVNLREKMEKQKQVLRSSTARNRPEEKPFTHIDRPIKAEINENLIRNILWLLVIIAVGVVSYFLFFNTTDEDSGEIALNWHAVKLVSGDIFYGQIEDTAGDPIILKNVYYNYDQESSETSNNLRLVKRGQETYGPAGEMSIVRAQVLYMEPLKQDSKVLQAILEYEK